MDISKKEFERLYISQGLSCRIISQLYDKSEWWVLARLKEYGIPVRRAGGSKFLEDLSGKVFGQYTVISREAPDRHANTRWRVRCSCGNERVLCRGNLTSGRSESCGKCRKSRLKLLVRKGKVTRRYKGINELSWQYWSGLERAAQRRKIPFVVSIKDGWSLYESQGKKCALSGRPIVFCRTFTNATDEQTASLDRIDSSKGYESGNIQWVHKNVNKMKWKFRQREFIEFCKDIAINNP